MVDQRHRQPSSQLEQTRVTALQSMELLEQPLGVGRRVAATGLDVR
jgi:hypothetical protein